MSSIIDCWIIPLGLCLIIFSSLLSSFDLIDGCSKKFQIRPNNIISAQKSLSLGAKFINKIPVSSFKECYSLCCNSSACTSAFWESNFPSICFLFDCRPPGHCIYVANENYDSIIQDTLSQNSSIRQKVSLTERCDSDHICIGNKTICSDGVCVCQSGWIHKKGHCVPSVCQSPELQFQCDDASACVAIYDKCNGIPECPDGSDENSCATDDPVSSSKHMNNTVRNSRKNYPTHLDVSESESQPTLLDPDQMVSASSKHSLSSNRRPNLLENLDNFAQPSSYPHIPSREYKSKYSLFRRIPTDTVQYEHSKDPVLVDFPSISDDSFVPTGRWPYSKYPSYLDSQVMNPKTEHLSHPSIPERNAFNDDPYIRLSPQESSFHIRPYTNDMPRYFHPHRDTFASVPRLKDPNYFRRPGFYENDSPGPLSDLVDPSVFRSPSRSEFYDGIDENTDPAPKLRKSHEKQVHSVTKFIYPKDTKKENNENKITATTPSSPVVSKASDGLLAAIQRSQSEGHTAALLLAFSLGLVCCFVGLLVVEWRRRQKLHKRTPQTTQPDSTIIFGGKPKVSMSRLRSQRKNRRDLPNDARRFADEENRALCDDLVL